VFQLSYEKVPILAVIPDKVNKSGEFVSNYNVFFAGAQLPVHADFNRLVCGPERTIQVFVITDVCVGNGRVKEIGEPAGTGFGVSYMKNGFGQWLCL
jgi:hypothetical protein